MTEQISSMGSEELLSLSRSDELDDGQAIEILRNPYCSAEVAECVAKHRRLLGSERIRRMVCSVRGMPTPRVADLVATLSWLGLLCLAQDPKTPPMVRRMSERRLLLKLPKLTLGERVGLARRTHRALYGPLFASAESPVIVSLLENPRLTESDVVQLLNSKNPNPVVFFAVLRSPRWAPRRGIRMAMARNPSTPLPVALSAVAELGPGELKGLVEDPGLPENVRVGVLGLLKKRGNILEKTVL
ncbi:MAG: hypothetical protein DRJ61_04970 [Acidobacteria bacterium]|nr:MAG: hypothetical protein DRJ65_12395 [Acidobacteriota bacterium]RLE34540.1 MAG: hypothetical protein DRJ61_04970 [Acidobacteriota bacterium]